MIDIDIDKVFLRWMPFVPQPSLVPGSETGSEYADLHILSVFQPYNTRTKDSLHYEIYRSTLGQRSIRYKGSLLWNSLFDELKDIVGTSTFINKTKEFFLLINDTSLVGLRAKLLDITVFILFLLLLSVYQYV